MTSPLVERRHGRYGILGVIGMIGNAMRSHQQTRLVNSHLHVVMLVKAAILAVFHDLRVRIGDGSRLSIPLLIIHRGA